MDPDSLQRILEGFAREPGRSAYALVRTPEWSWAGGVYADALMPAASVLKLVVGMALEPLLAHLGPDRAGELVRSEDTSILHALSPEHELSARELHALMLSASDAPATRWAVREAGMDAIRAAAHAAGLRRTRIEADEHFGVLGHTTAREAVDLMIAAADPARFPACSRALRRSIINSRIPLGVVADDIEIAHKTGTLRGVAHDVAHLTCDRGDAWLAFLSGDQHDTLVTGYDMGTATRTLLEYAGLHVTSTRSVSARP